MLIYKLAAVAVLLQGSGAWALPPRDEAYGDAESLTYAESFGDDHFHDQWSFKLEDWLGKFGHGKPSPGEDEPSDEPGEPPRGPPTHPPGAPPEHPPHPHFPHHPPNLENKTIFQALQDDDRFSRLFKIVNFTDNAAATLNDTNASITFFAVPNKALEPPKHRGPPPGERPPPPPEDSEWEALYERASNPRADLSDDIPLLEAFVDAYQLDEDHGDEKKKEIFKKIAEAILSYHILPEYLTIDDLSKNSTFGTSLTINDGSLDGNAQRIRVFSVPRVFKRAAVVINFGAEVVVPDVKAKNGIVHVVNHPILPPASALQTLFFIPDLFSTFTSAIQRVGLSDAIEWRYVPGKDGAKGTVQGSPSSTVFVPTNKAFRKLPRKLQLFLFSPFGEHVLKKLLQFHIIPDFILHSDWTHNATDSIAGASADPDAQEAFRYIKTNDFDNHPTTEHCHKFDKRVKVHRGMISESPEFEKKAFHHPHGPPRTEFPHPEPIYSLNLTLPTLLDNHTVQVNVLQFEKPHRLPHQKPTYSTHVFAHGVPVSFADGVVRNGAIHLVDKVLNPRKVASPPPGLPPPPPHGPPHRGPHHPDHPPPPPPPPPPHGHPPPPSGHFPPPPPGPPGYPPPFPHGHPPPPPPPSFPHGHPPPPPPPGPHGPPPPPPGIPPPHGHHCGCSPPPPPPPPPGPPGSHGPATPFPPGPNDFLRHSSYQVAQPFFGGFGDRFEENEWEGWEEWLLEWANEN